MAERPMRIIFTALALCALSFFVGVVGDLSTPPANAGQTVTLRIPPPIPVDAPRAAPLPPLVSTPTAAAAPPASMPADLEGAPAESVRSDVEPLAAYRQMAMLPKLDLAALAKAKERKFT